MLNNSNWPSVVFQNPFDAEFLCPDCAKTLEKVSRDIDYEAELAKRIVRKTGKCVVYFIGPETSPIKVGVAADPSVRLKELQTGHPYRLRILAIVPGGRDLERYYHSRFAADRLNGEWFNRSPDILAEIEHLSPSNEGV